MSHSQQVILQRIRIFSELLEDILKKEPKEADGCESVIVVDNVPVVGEERLEKLKSVISKIFSKFGTIQSDHYPQDGNKTKGYFVTRL